MVLEMMDDFILALQQVDMGGMSISVFSEEDISGAHSSG